MTHTITLVSDIYLSKTEALRALSRLLDTVIDDSNPSDAVLNLEDGVVLSIEVPKFGEDLPLTLDLTGDNITTVETATTQLVDQVYAGLSWTMTRVGE